MGKQLRKHEHCLNCGHPVDKNFCPDCGQENTHYTVSLGALTRDIWDEFVKFDGKFFATLVPLLFRPGFLTNEYVAGRRARYLSPFKMYLVVSALFFLFLAWKNPIDINLAPDRVTIGPSRSPGKQAGPKPIRGDLHLGATKIDLDRLPARVEDYDAQQNNPSNKDRYPPALRFFVRQLIKLNQSPQQFLQGFLNSLPNMMFFLLPVFALLLKLFYLRSRRLYVEHLVFAVHSHTVFFLLLPVNVAVDNAFIQILVGVVLLVHPILALRAAYKQSVSKTLFKATLLGFAYLFLLVFGFLGALGVALLTL